MPFAEERGNIKGTACSQWDKSCPRGGAADAGRIRTADADPCAGSGAGDGPQGAGAGAHRCGVRPFLSRKYDITKHPNYRYLSDADPRNAFDIAAFLSTRLKLKANDTYETFEAKVSEEDTVDPNAPLDQAAMYGG